MGRMTMQQSKDVPKGDFGVPSKAPGPGSYPMPDRAHAANAKARAAQFASPSVKAKVDAKANKVLGEDGDDSPMRKMVRKGLQ